jgi:hypothetical protein
MRRSVRCVVSFTLLATVWCAATPVRAQEQGAVPATELPRVVLPADVAAWTPLPDPGSPQPRRQTRRGARIGAVVGALTGLGIGSLMALWCRGLSTEPCDAAIPVITVLGGVSGAVGGAIIGAAVPTEAATPGTPAPAVERRIGSATLSLGAAHARQEGYPGDWVDGPRTAAWVEGSGPAARANVYAELRPWLAIGPEAGIVWAGDLGRVRHAAVSIRVTRSMRQLSPYVAVNAGAYQSTGPSLEFLGGGIGAGVRLAPRLGSRSFVDIDARYSRNLQHIEPMRMRGVNVGGGFYW